MNNTNGHTPGEWEAEPADMFGDHNIVLRERVEDMDHRAIAAVVSNIRPESEVSANARLIAAAPELLAALEAVIASSPIEDRVLPMVIAAIRKARGEPA